MILEIQERGCALCKEFMTASRGVSDGRFQVVKITRYKGTVIITVFMWNENLSSFRGETETIECREQDLKAAERVH